MSEASLAPQVDFPQEYGNEDRDSGNSIHIHSTLLSCGNCQGTESSRIVLRTMFMLYMYLAKSETV